MATDVTIGSESSIVVVAAHPDDVKNCTGTILRALDLGADVALVQVTHGEGLGGATTKHEAVAMGATRVDELMAFLSEIGVAASRTFLIGIPNTSAQPLAALRDDFFPAEGLPFHDPVLATDRVIYEDAYRPGMPLIGAPLVSALAELLVDARPTHVITHHPADDHSDHRATAFFVRRALEATTGEPEVLGSLVYYRRLGWPVEGDTYLTPEVEQYPFGFDMGRLELSDDERARKERACEIFVPTLPRDYINSYMKQDEIFWRL